MDLQDAQNLSESLARWREDLAANTRSGAEVACDFVFLHCERLHGKAWRGAKVNAEVEACGSRLELLRRYQLKGVRLDSRLGLLGWLEGRYSLDLRTDRPTPMEMLEQQCLGRRIATLHLLPEEQFTPIGRHAGAYEFLLHDLEHAEKFFAGAFSGQVKFFKLIRAAIAADFFAELITDARFVHELDYLISDMNSHPVHLVKYLKAIVLEALKRRGAGDLEFDDWTSRLFALWDLPEDAKTSAMRMNCPDLENEADRLRVSRFFMESTGGLWS